MSNCKDTSKGLKEIPTYNTLEDAERLARAEAIVSLAAKHKQAIQRGWDDTHANEMAMTFLLISKLQNELWEQLDEYVREFPEVK
ncbi:MAG: hypothetical protein GX257_10045 [Clostridiales bacterium]|nr:hypothetical protein [Clostridiales bacterium]